MPDSLYLRVEYEPQSHDEIANYDHPARAKPVNEKAFQRTQQRALRTGEREGAGQRGAIPAEGAFQRHEERADALKHGCGHQHQHKAG